MSAGQRILVTGASGFVGSHIVNRARRDELDVVAASRGASGEGAVSFDICDAANVDSAIREVSPTFVIHCAAYGVNYAEQDWNSALAVNVQGTLNVLEAAARHEVQRFVQIGSGFEYGSRAGKIVEDAPLNPTAPYGATKAAATLLIRERARALGMPLVVARPFSIWGPREAAHRVIPQVIAACVSRSPLQLTSCEVTRDYMYVEDVADNILALTVAPKVATGTMVNIATGEGLLLRDFVLSIAKLLDGEHLMQFGAISYRATEMPCLVADVTRMHRLLGVRPKTSLQEGLRRMMNCDRIARG
jgi:nucleoside-diphosphate-sugar epimerase